MKNKQSNYLLDLIFLLGILSPLIIFLIGNYVNEKYFRVKEERVMYYGPIIKYKQSTSENGFLSSFEHKTDSYNYLQLNTKNEK